MISLCSIMYVKATLLDNLIINSFHHFYYVTSFSECTSSLSFCISRFPFLLSYITSTLLIKFSIFIAGVDLRFIAVQKLFSS